MVDEIYIDKKFKPQRRKFLKQLAGTVVGATVLSTGPYVHASPKTRLRVMGTHVTLQEPLRLQAEKELGVELVFEAMGDAALLHKASTEPEAFDLYEHWSDSINIVWQADTIQAIDKQRLQYWSEINDLTKTGRLTPEANLGAGDAPYKLLHIQSDNKLGSTETDRISFMPYVHNVDSFGYNTAVIPQGIPYETESWGWMLDKKYRGKVGLINAPTIGIFDMVLAAQAQELMTFKDIGALTIPEIDKLFEILIRKKNEGHFNGFWNSVPQSIEWMQSGKVVIESMFSPAVSALNGRGIPVTYAAPKEGYRGWHGVMCLSAKAEGKVKDAAYAYMNWWLSGWPGAFIARQGYYISNPHTSKPFMSEAEWDYWYEGKPATIDLTGTDGQVSVKTGQIRNGGAYTRRLSNIAVWNTVMPNYEYSLQRWYELLTF